MKSVNRNEIILKSKINQHNIQDKKLLSRLHDKNDMLIQPRKITFFVYISYSHILLKIW